MALLTRGQKLVRVLKFFMGLRNPRIAEALASRGFGEKQRNEGWVLFGNLVQLRLGAPAATAVDPTTLAKLDEWENQWFPIIEATLRRNFPALCDKVFLNLTQAEGTAVIVTVSTMLDRVCKMTDGSYAADGPAARDLLTERGFTPAVVGEGAALLDRLKGVATTEPPNLDEIQEQDQKAEDDLWGWYLEWSQIARAVIKKRPLLRQLGFLTASGKLVADDEPAEGEADLAVPAGEAKP